MLVASAGCGTTMGWAMPYFSSSARPSATHLVSRALLTGMSLATLRDTPASAHDGGFSKALTQAIAQIDRLRAAGEPAPQAQGAIPALALGA
jgi:hypothetical protein